MEEFERCYGSDPNGFSPRSESHSTAGRWRAFTADQIVERAYKLDTFKWMRDDADELEQKDPTHLLLSAERATAGARDAVEQAQKLWSLVKDSLISTTVKLGGVMTQRKEQIQINDSQIYMRCRVQLHARGVVLRDQVFGASIKTKRQQICRADQFLVAEIDAKVGGFGIVPRVLDGAIVSSHYFLFELDDTKVLPGYMSLVAATEYFQSQVKAQGTTNYAAIRPRDVLGYEIPLPDLHTQHALVDLLASAERAHRQLAAATNALGQLGPSAVALVAGDTVEDVSEDLVGTASG